MPGEGQAGTQPPRLPWAAAGPRVPRVKPPPTPLINVEEKIDRFVGRRGPAADSLQTGMQLQATAAELHQSFKHRWWPKGVYRFKTHEEADAWMTQMLARSSLPKT